MLNRADANKLFLDGEIVLSDMEIVGVGVDAEYLTKSKDELLKKIDESYAKLDRDWGDLWTGVYGNKTNFKSGEQLAYILFEVLKVGGKRKTEKGNLKSDKATLEKVDHPIVKEILKARRNKKILDSVNDFLRHTVDGRIHPFANLDRIITYRSSYDSPNMQNVPVRDREMSKYIRGGVIPSDGNVLIEIDYKSLEVVIAACYHQDKNMIKYLTDSSRDMHRDTAQDVFLLSDDQWTKELRFYCKNQVVFPFFYGSWYKPCAESLWSIISEKQLKTADGVLILEHLRGKNIKNFDDFLEHLRQFEYNFWYKRFPQYREWRERAIENYNKRGYVDLLTGFRIFGPLARNDIFNYPVQGAAFHCLLWSLIEIKKILDNMKMKSKLILEIHDSLLADVPKDEISKFLKIAKKVMTKKLLYTWKWVSIPLDIEVEISATNWYDKAGADINRLMKGGFNAANI